MDWQEKLPFLAWKADGSGVAIDLDDDGKWGLRLAEGGCIPFGDERLAEYEQYVAQETAKSWRPYVEAALACYDQITDIDNSEPFPGWFVRKNPEFIRWLSGENERYRPTIFEYGNLYPAHAERIRRLKENALTGQRTADSKTDSPEKKEKKLPPQDVNNCIRYVREQKRLIGQGNRLKATKKQLIAEHLEPLGITDTSPMEKNLQPKRYGWLLTAGEITDK